MLAGRRVAERGDVPGTELDRAGGRVEGGLEKARVPEIARDLVDQQVALRLLALVEDHEALCSPARVIPTPLELRTVSPPSERPGAAVR